MNSARKKSVSHKRGDLYRKLLLVYWKDEIDSLSHTTGISMREVCDYIGVSYSRDIAIYTKVPKKASALIGIGMAYKLPVEEIDRWLVEYGKKHRLYAKDVFGDLVWIYLINCNHNDPDRSINYYRLYEKCLDEAVRIYTELYDQHVTQDADTEDVRSSLLNIPYDPAFKGLRGFIIDNMDAFKTAYAKSRSILCRYLNEILRVRGMEDPKKGKLNTLRGYLDDSMINYISGGQETIHIIKDRKTGERSSRVKPVPKGRKTHISMCLSLGMSADDINRYLTAMGYGRLDPENSDERMLLKMLDLWDDAHPKQRLFKSVYLSDEPQPDYPVNVFAEKSESYQDAGSDPIHAGGINLQNSGKTSVLHRSITEEDEVAAVSEMLQLRQSLYNEFKARGENFPYFSE